MSQLPLAEGRLMHRPAQILIVEDEPREALSLKQVLVHLGFMVVATVGSGEEAIAQVAQLTPDLVLMDIRLAGRLDGIDTGAYLLAHSPVPLIYLTALADDSLLERMKATEPYGYLLKPYPIHELQVAIELALHKHVLNKQLQETNQRLEQEIAARQQVEQLVQQQNEQLQAQNVILRESEARYRAVAEENARLLEQSRQDADTKAILLHEVNHRVKNNLAAMIGLLQLELRSIGPEDQTRYRSLIDDLTGRIESLALVHNLLSANQWAPLPLAKLAENVLQIAPAMLARQHVVQVDISPSSAQLTPKQASALGLILNELVTNSAKYAKRRHEPIRLSLTICQFDNEVCLNYRDNGPGYPEQVLLGQHHSVGLYLIEALAEGDLEGKLTLSNDQGAVTELCFALVPDIQSAPLPAPAQP